MARKRYTAEEIIGQLRTVEIELGKGLGVVARVASSASPNRPTIAGRRNTADCAWIRPNG